MGLRAFPRLCINNLKVTALGRTAVWGSFGKGQANLEGWRMTPFPIHHVTSQPQGMDTWLGPLCPPPAFVWQLGPNSHNTKPTSFAWQASTCPLLFWGQGEFLCSSYFSPMITASFG